VGVLLAWRGASPLISLRDIWWQPLFSPWIAAEQEAPNDRAHKILRAGITWPTNIVNMRQPEIFEDLIKRRGSMEENEGTIRHGVAASTTMAVDITPNHPLVRDYLDYVPARRIPRCGSCGPSLVHQPVYNAVNRYHPISETQDDGSGLSLSGLDALVDKLEAGTEDSDGHGHARKHPKLAHSHS